jgi:GAF domain-containing protein
MGDADAIGAGPEQAVFGSGELSAADAFARLATELHDSDGVEETVDTVVQFAVRALHCTHAGVILMAHGREPEVAAVTDPIIETVYLSQIEACDGPVITAAREEAVVRVEDARTDERWPHWSELVGGFGIRSVLHLPLRVGDKVSGVLSLYSTEPDAFADPDDEAVAQILVRHAAVAVATAREEATLAQAVDARKLIGQAMGILMERYDLDGDRAFEVLKRYSQDNNVKLRDVALHLIETRKLPTNLTR